MKFYGTRNHIILKNYNFAFNLCTIKIQYLKLCSRLLDVLWLNV